MGCACSYIEDYQLNKSTLENTEWLSLKGQRKRMKVVDVYDADTITVVFRMNGKNYLEKMRLAGIDSAEIRPRADSKNRDSEKKIAQKGKERLVELCMNKIVTVHCENWEKFGRLLGTIYVGNCKESVNDLLIRENLAYKYDGKTKLKFEEWHGIE